MDILILIIVVLVATVINEAIGFVWYGLIFGKLWMRLAGKKKEEFDAMPKRELKRIHIISFLGSFAMYLVFGLIATGIQGAVLVNALVFTSLAVLLGTGTSLSSHLFLQDRNQMALFFLHYLYVVIGVFISTAFIFYFV